MKVNYSEASEFPVYEDFSDYFERRYLLVDFCIS